MRDTFSAFYRASELELEGAWKDATFVLDTNILLNLYRYPMVARNELLDVFRRLQDQLWIPFHVGLEFQRNRIGVIAGQQRSFSEVKAALDSGVQTMSQKLSALQLTNRHSIIDAAPFLTEIESSVSAFKARLDNLKGTDDVGLDKDIIRDQLDVILKGRIGEAPKSEELAKIQKEGEIRFKHEMPPGYEDAVKDKRQSASFMYGGQQYESKYGDLIVWKQLINHAKAKSIKKIIFLTDDEKEDWWQSVKADGPKKIGPRPELREEIKREAGVEFFHMYNSESFLRYAKQIYGAVVQDQSIDEVAGVLRQNRPRFLEHPSSRIISLSSDVGRVVTEWLERGLTTKIVRFRTGPGLWIDGRAVELSILVVPNGSTIREVFDELVIDSAARVESAPKLAVVVGGELDHEGADEWLSNIENNFKIKGDYSMVYGRLDFNESVPHIVRPFQFTPMYGYGNIASELMGHL